MRPNLLLKNLLLKPSTDKDRKQRHPKCEGYYGAVGMSDLLYDL